MKIQRLHAPQDQNTEYVKYCVSCTTQNITHAGIEIEITNRIINLNTTELQTFQQ